MPRSAITVIYAAFHGGGSWSPEQNGTRFDTLDDVKAEWRRRERDIWRYPGWGAPSYQTATNDEGYYHAANVWFVNLPLEEQRINDDGTYDTTDAYPDRELVIGPRGGLSWRNC